MKPRPKEKESDIQHAVLQYLSLKGIFHYRNSVGAFKTERGFYRFGAVGSGDIIAVIGGIYVAIEIKGTGKSQTPAQETFQANLEHAGGQYWLIHSLDELINKLETLK